MTMWLLVCVVLIIGGGTLTGAPYLPTKRRQIKSLMTITKISSKDLFIDLGCGDGSVLLAAARRGARAIGYEINPFWVLVARLRTFKQRNRVKIIWANMWGQRLPKDATIVYVFLIKGFMDRLERKILREAKGMTVVSFGFKLPNLSVQKKQDGLYVYNIKG